VPSLNIKALLQQFVIASPEKHEYERDDEKEENLARRIPKRVVWEDVPECITVGLKREGFAE